jgi:hypothetical protein
MGVAWEQHARNIQPGLLHITSRPIRCQECIRIVPLFSYYTLEAPITARIPGDLPDSWIYCTVSIYRT